MQTYVTKNATECLLHATHHLIEGGGKGKELGKYGYLRYLRVV